MAFNLKFWQKKSTSSINSQRTLNQTLLEIFRSGCNENVSPAQAYDYYKFNSALSDAVDMVSSKFSSIVPIVKKEGREIISNHPVLNFLKSPNKIQEYEEIASAMAINYLLHRNLFIEAIGSVKTKPNEIYVVRNSGVSITEGQNSAIYIVTINNFYSFLSGNFDYTAESGRILDTKGTTSGLRELFHIKGFSQTSEGLLGQTKLSSINRELKVLEQSWVRYLASLEKGFSGTGVLSVETEDNDAFDRFKEDVKNNFSGAGNAGRMLVSKGKDVKHTPIDNRTNKDMQFLDNHKEAKTTIYQRNEIPQPLIDQSAQTYNNYQAALVALYDNAVFPLADKIFSGLTRMFRVRNMLKEDESISYDVSSIPAIQLRRNEEVKVLKDTGVLTQNELRSKLGYEEIDGGDILYAPATALPAGTDNYVSDNLKEPKNSFTELMKKQGFSEAEIKDYWKEFNGIK